MFSLKFGRLWEGIHYFSLMQDDVNHMDLAFIEQKVKKTENYATKFEVIE